MKLVLSTVAAAALLVGGSVAFAQSSTTTGTTGTTGATGTVTTPGVSTTPGSVGVATPGARATDTTKESVGSSPVKPNAEQGANMGSRPGGGDSSGSGGSGGAGGSGSGGSGSGGSGGGSSGAK